MCKKIRVTYWHKVVSAIKWQVVEIWKFFKIGEKSMSYFYTLLTSRVENTNLKVSNRTIIFILFLKSNLL